MRLAVCKRNVLWTEKHKAETLVSSRDRLYWHNGAVLIQTTLCKDGPEPMQAIFIGVTADRVHIGPSNPQFFLSTYLGQTGASPGKPINNESGNRRTRRRILGFYFPRASENSLWGALDTFCEGFLRSVLRLMVSKTLMIDRHIDNDDHCSPKGIAD